MTSQHSGLSIYENPWSHYTHHRDAELSLEEVDVFGEVESILTAVPNHVRVQHIIRRFEYLRQKTFVRFALYRKFQQLHQQVYNLWKEI